MLPYTSPQDESWSHAASRNRMTQLFPCQVRYATLPAACCYHLQRATHQYLRWGCSSKRAEALCQPHCVLMNGQRYGSALHCVHAYANHPCKAPGCCLGTWPAIGSKHPPRHSLHLSGMHAGAGLTCCDSHLRYTTLLGAR